MKYSSIETPFYSSLVAEHIVHEGREPDFKRWHINLTKTAESYEGFLRCDLCPPLHCADHVIKCYYITHFDSPENLTKWIESPERQNLLEIGQDIFYAYRFKSFTTGLEGWFSLHSGDSEYRSLGPPLWKQIMAVVLGLYPVVMIQAIAFSTFGIMQNWSLANSMIVNNLITSTILSLLVMPFLSNHLRFWLQPAYRPMTLQKDLTGMLIVSLTLGIMVIIFNEILKLV
ncbi:MAG: hypothetical protein DCE90_03070 [Pseudanabaena sp.]|nr:MAG: hypothetical protein DCE90_03070 [Pseudanabaena sp.]